ncbi:MAG: hypothetical protein MJ059_08625 [Lachnospiraceae bacterium]|nr:hypothetical protein [Lachnospiraceae bacterium]
MRSWFASITSRKIGKELRSDIYSHVQQLSLENIDRLKPASIITRATNDVTQIQNFIYRSGSFRVFGFFARFLMFRFRPSFS